MNGSKIETSGRRLVVLVATAAVTFCLLPSGALAEDAPDPAFRKAATADEKAHGDVLAKRMIDGLGGADAFRKLRYVGFAFVPKKGGKVLSRREHAWDPGAGRARVRWQKDGKDVTAWLTLADKSGVVVVNGARVTDDAARKAYLDDAYAAWVNDTYWLISPYKAFDPGVHRAAVAGKLRTSFDDGVGLTPGDVYLYDFDDDGELAGWSYLLQSGRTGSFRFDDEKQLAGVTFFGRKVSRGDDFEIALEDIDASAQPRPSAVTPPSAP